MAIYNPYQMYPQNYQQYPPQNYQQNQQIQNGGFTTVRNEEEARNYPVAHGVSMTFKNETAPYIYTKTMGFSQMDQPIFEKYRLVKEEQEEKREEPNYIEMFESQISALWNEVNSLKEKKPVSRKKAEVADDTE